MSLLPAELRTFFKSSILMPKNDVVASNFSKEDLGKSEISVADELKKLKDLLEEGVLTNKEFEEQKKK